VIGKGEKYAAGDSLNPRKQFFENDFFSIMH
jgi:hypothetical protein